MKTKFNYLLMLLLAVPLAFSNCSSSKDEADSIDPEDDLKELEFTPASLALNPGAEKTVSISGNGEYKLSKISKEGVLDVSISGDIMTVKAKDDAEADKIEITVTDAEGKIATMNVTVTKEVIKLVTKITVSKEQLSLLEGTTKTLAELEQEVKVEPADATDKAYTMKVIAGAEFVKMEKGNSFVGLKAGTATVEVKANDEGGKTATFKVVVDADNKPIPVKTITVTGAKAKMIKGSSATLAELGQVVTITPDNATDATYSIKSLNTNIVSVDTKTGKLTALAAGNVKIELTTNDGSKLTATFDVEVIADNQVELDRKGWTPSVIPQDNHTPTGVVTNILNSNDKQSWQNNFLKTFPLPYTLVVDMKKAHSFNKVVISRNLYESGNVWKLSPGTKVVEIEVSDDNKNYRKVGNFDFGGVENTDINKHKDGTIEFPVVTAQYLRILITESNYANGDAGISEVKVFGF